MEDEAKTCLALSYKDTDLTFAAAIDVSNLKQKQNDKDRLLLCIEYLDNYQLNNLETLLLQHEVKLVYTYGEEKSQRFQAICKLLNGMNIELVTIRRKSVHGDDAEHALSVLIGEDNLNKHPDVLHLKNAIACASTLISERGLSSNMSACHYGVQSVSIRDYMRLDSSAMETLNIFPVGEKKDSISSIYGLLNSTVTGGLGARLLRRWLNQPLVKEKEINQRLDIVQFFMEEMEIREQLRASALKGIVDIEKYVRKLELRKKFSLQDLYILYQCVCKLGSIRSVFSECSNPLYPVVERELVQGIEEISSGFSKFVEMVDKVIDKEGLGMSPPEFNISPSFDEELRTIAEEKNTVYRKIQSKFNEYLGEYSSLDIKLERNARYGYCFRVTSKFNNEVSKMPDVKVLQVLKNGIYFADDELCSLSAEYDGHKSSYATLQQSFIAKILDIVASYIPLFHTFSSLIAQIDVLCAFAHVSVNSVIPYTRPILLQKKANDRIHVEESRHPLLELQATMQFIPNNYEMQGASSANPENQNVMIITGPNMGGKSTYMRQLGVLIVLAQIGCFVPAKVAEFPPFTALYTRIGASDHQSRGVSTFMSEMIDMSNILSLCGDEKEEDNSLIIIDELGRGTSTYDGMGLSWGVLEYIITHFSSCYCLFTTHYYEVTTIAKKYPNVQNVHVTALFKGNYVTMMYGVSDGATDKSFGINVAQLCNFPKCVIENANKKVVYLECVAKSNQSTKKRERMEDFEDIDKKIRLLKDCSVIEEEAVKTLIDTIKDTL